LVWFLIALYIMYSSFGIIKKWFLMILDVALEDKEVSKIINIIHNNKKIKWYHYLKTRRSGKYKFVEVHLVFTPIIQLIEAHNSADEIIEYIKEIDIDSQWIVNIHLDPYDDSRMDDKSNIWF
jgi:divalent metal cation (Fe/Co/Zn/Cd) transporter